MRFPSGLPPLGPSHPLPQWHGRAALFLQIRGIDMPRFTPRFSHTLIASALVVLSGASWAGGQPERVLAELQQSQRERVPGELLVQFKPGVAALDRVGGT